MNASPIFVYQAYGSWRFRQQAKLSILSLFAHSVPPENIIVFTDEPAQFTELSVGVIAATKRKIKQWCGPCSFHHRLKIELIRHVRKERSGPIVYVDSDTVWLNSPATICNALVANRVVLHEREAKLSAKFFPEYLQALHDAGLLSREHLTESEPAPIWVYNAGVVGLPATIDVEVLNEVLAVCDELVLRVPQKMEWVEQLAFSFVLGRRAAIDNCKADVLHYWRDSAVFTRAIKDFSTEMLFQLCCDSESLMQLLSQQRQAKRSLGNQLVVRTNRLFRSVVKRRRELYVFLENMRHRSDSVATGKIV